MNESEKIKKLSAENEQLKKRCQDLELVIMRILESEYGEKPDDIEKVINTYLISYDLSRKYFAEKGWLDDKWFERNAESVKKLYD